MMKLAVAEEVRLPAVILVVRLTVLAVPMNVASLGLVQFPLQPVGAAPSVQLPLPPAVVPLKVRLAARADGARARRAKKKLKAES